MVTMSQMQTLLQTACNVTDSVPLTCQQVGWFIDRRGKPVGGLRWRRRVPPSLLSCRPAGCLQTTAILLPPTHPPPPEELGLLGMAMLSTHWLSSSYPLHPPLCRSCRVGHAVNKQTPSSIHPISSSWAWAPDKICNKKL